MASAPQPPAERLTVVARGGMANLGGAAVSALANFALTVVLAHYLSPAAAGVFFTATSLLLILQTVGRLGADTGAVYFIARWRATGQLDRVHSGLRAAVLPVIAACLALATLMIVFAPQLATHIGGPHTATTDLLRALAAMLPVAAAYEVALGATRGFGWMRPTVVIDKIARPAAQLVLVAALLLFGVRGLLALGCAWVLPYLGAAALAARMLRTALARHAVPAGRADVGRADPGSAGGATTARMFWAFTLPRAAASVAQIVLQRLDIVLVAVMRGATTAAIYTAATRFLVVGQFVNQAISAPVQPELSSSLAAGRWEQARELYRASTSWLVLLSWPLFGLATVFAPTYLSLFGHGYRDGRSVVMILAVAMIVASGVGLVDSVIIMAGRTRWNLWTTLAAVTINVGGDLVLIPRYGLVGAALGWFAAILAANLVPLAVCWTRLDLHPFGRSTGLAYLLAATCWIVVPWLAYLLSGGALLTVAAITAVSALGYGACLWHWRDAFGLGSLLRRRPAAG